MSDDKLTSKEKIELVVQAGLNAIPTIGGSLSAIYFGAKQEKRFKRIENFYNGLKNDFDKFKDKVKNLDEQNKEELTGIIEEINENVETDYTEEKLEYFKNCFYNTLSDISKGSYGKRKYFISILGELTELDIQVLINLHKANEGDGYVPNTTNKEGNNPEFIGTLEKLKSYGLIYSKLHGTLRPGINWSEITLYAISDFGREFVRYCLENPKDKLN